MAGAAGAKRQQPRFIAFETSNVLDHAHEKTKRIRPCLVTLPCDAFSSRELMLKLAYSIH
jgi:hypothetical protein